MDDVRDNGPQHENEKRQDHDPHGLGVSDHPSPDSMFWASLTPDSQQGFLRSSHFPDSRFMPASTAVAVSVTFAARGISNILQAGR
jgi:hypothetical protein